MDWLTLRLMIAMRARPSAPPAERANATNLRSAPEQRSSSALQLSIDFASACILASTPRHFTHSSPSGARKVNRPNGSSLVKGATAGDAGTSLATSDRVPIDALTDASCTASDLPRDSPSCLARTALMVKNRTGGGVGAA